MINGYDDRNSADSSDGETAELRRRIDELERRIDLISRSGANPDTRWVRIGGMWHQVTHTHVSEYGGYGVKDMSGPGALPII